VLSHKRLRSRTLQLELLESRELLSVVALPVQPAQEISPLKRSQPETIKGTLSGQGYVIPITTSQGTTHFGASGSTTVLGSATLAGSDSYSLNKHHAVKYTNGEATITDLSGDHINVSFSGSGHKVGVADFTFSVKGSVIGGTGAFAGAKGKVTGTGSLNVETSVFSIQLTVTLTHI